MIRWPLLATGLLAATVASAGTVVVAPTPVIEWKAVYGTVEPRNTIPARARIGGVLTELGVSEGDQVKAGQGIATVRDEKIAFQIAALAAQLRALQSQLETAQTELQRGQALVDKGVITSQRLDQLRTEVSILHNQISGAEAQRSVVIQQSAEGEVFAPSDGRVLTVPVTQDAVIVAGETIANIGGGGFFLRLAIPERHATALKLGALIQINAGGIRSTGRLAKIYPQIENGRVTADVEVDKLETGFVNARVLVEVPVGERSALLVPRGAVTTRFGIDFVAVLEKDVQIDRAVMLGEPVTLGNGEFIEILTGLAPGDVVATP
ncbi:efflux RND transporter periplasmic adaptor subunit [Phyllobacterium ifriqiyense]|uniref:efflux RND transporter periplasmic adaptor subunit n=1 Tax=Phyllobacterium ifriqiyense TaxID=314238 RepID=UPI003393C8EC